jgi:hypothetical protein
MDGLIADMFLHPIGRMVRSGSRLGLPLGWEMVAQFDYII